jgi:hypothetical protein
MVTSLYIRNWPQCFQPTSIYEELIAVFVHKGDGPELLSTAAPNW